MPRQQGYLNLNPRRIVQIEWDQPSYDATSYQQPSPYYYLFIQRDRREVINKILALAFSDALNFLHRIPSIGRTLSFKNSLRITEINGPLLFIVNHPDEQIYIQAKVPVKLENLLFDSPDKKTLAMCTQDLTRSFGHELIHLYRRKTVGEFEKEIPTMIFDLLFIIYSNMPEECLSKFQEMYLAADHDKNIYITAVKKAMPILINLIRKESGGSPRSPTPNDIKAFLTTIPIQERKKLILRLLDKTINMTGI